jgi:hypothetical protein
MLARVRSLDGRAKLGAAVFVVAFVARLLPTILGGGLAYYGRYDDGVYYTAADALTFGRVPYKQFVLLHPPGIMLVLAPFALLGRITSDAIGLSVARLAFMGIGSVNAVLVTLIAYRWGRWRAVVAGLMYAGWAGAVYSENATLLEPLGGMALLIALLLLLRGDGEPSPRAEVLAGVVLGLACAMKIWYVAPWAVVVLYQLFQRRYQRALRIAVGGAVPLAVVLAPFFALAPRRMYDMVVRDQILRKVNANSRTGRLDVIFATKHVVAHHGAALYLSTVIVVGLTVIAALVCCRDRRSGLIVAVLAGNLAVLYWSPSFFYHYSALVAAPIVLVMSIGLGELVGRIRGRTLARAVAAVAVGLILAAGVRTATTPTGKPFPTASFVAALPSGCIAADDPTALIDLNRLSHDLRAGCRVPVDVTGITYDTLRGELPNGAILGRRKNLPFQRWLYAYLTSSRAFVIIRAPYDAMPRAFKLLIRQRPVLAAGRGLFLRQGFATTG